MEPMKQPKKYERDIQKEIINFLKLRDWDVSVTHGTSLMVGFPDLYVVHASFGARWVEVKRPGGKLTNSQRIKFTRWAACNIGVWVMEAANEFNYQLLFGPRNWSTYL